MKKNKWNKKIKTLTLKYIFLIYVANVEAPLIYYKNIFRWKTNDRVTTGAGKAEKNGDFEKLGWKSWKTSTLFNVEGWRSWNF